MAQIKRDLADAFKTHPNILQSIYGSIEPDPTCILSKVDFAYNVANGNYGGDDMYIALYRAYWTTTTITSALMNRLHDYMPEIQITRMARYLLSNYNSIASKELINH
jgi:hypothetical protein